MKEIYESLTREHDIRETVDRLMNQISEEKILQMKYSDVLSKKVNTILGFVDEEKEMEYEDIKYKCVVPCKREISIGFSTATADKDKVCIMVKIDNKGVKIDMSGIIIHKDQFLTCDEDAIIGLIVDRVIEKVGSV
jgi:hypothetical protein